MERDEAIRLAALVRDHCRSYEEAGFSCDLCLLYSACVECRKGYCPPYGKVGIGTIKVFDETLKKGKGIRSEDKEAMDALEKLNEYAANSECKNCIFRRDECTFARSIPSEWEWV